MRLRSACVTVIGALFLSLSAVPASAQWFVSPSIGASFGGDSDNSKVNVDASAGYLGNGLGFEVDLGVTPNFFDTSSNDFNFDGNVTTFMFNGMVVAPSNMTVRPYGTGGIGLIRTRVHDAQDLFNASNSDFGFNVGAGLLGNFSDNIGWRGDVRYLRSLEDPEKDNEFDIGVGDFDFWRSTFGVTFMWGR